MRWESVKYVEMSTTRPSRCGWRAARMCSTVLNVRFTRSLRAAPIAVAKLSVTASKQLILSIAAQIVHGERESATCGIVRLKHRNQNKIDSRSRNISAAVLSQAALFSLIDCKAEEEMLRETKR